MSLNMLRSLPSRAIGLASFVLLAAALTPARAVDTDIAHILAPTGKLRAALYPGTPTSILPNPNGEARGVGYEIGKSLADKLHVPYAPIVYHTNAEVQDAIKTGAADVAFTNASPARAKEVDFGPVYLRIELGYLLPEGSPVKNIGEIDSAGRRVAVTTHSSSDAELSRDLKNATVVRIATIKEAIDELSAHQVDAFATNKAILFEMSEKVPGSHVLDGRWGEERHAIAIPKGREAALGFLGSFTEEIQKSGLVHDAAERAGLKGVIPPGG
jgi:polar amino acid transport system substrate-binding protein